MRLLLRTACDHYLCGNSMGIHSTKLIALNYDRAKPVVGLKLLPKHTLEIQLG